jgi:DNA polymerase-3 subunit epsilon
VYWFVDGRGVPLYVGKAANLRQRVRSYFSGDDRRKIGNLLRETVAVRHQIASSTLEAAVVEARLIHRLRPRYNRQGTQWRAAPFVALTLAEAFPRLKVVREPRADGSLYLGPLPTPRQAAAIVEAIQTAVPLRRCTERLGPRRPVPVRADPCLPAQLGVAHCPCSGRTDPAAYAATVDQVVEGLTVRPGALLDPLRQRLAELADARRYEEAALVRDRAGALAAALRRQRGLGALAASGRVRLRLPGGVTAELMDGILMSSCEEIDGQSALPFDSAPPRDGAGADRPTSDGPPTPLTLRPEVALELVTVATWLDREAHRVRLESCDGVLASAWPAIPTFAPGQPLAPPKRLVA